MAQSKSVAGAVADLSNELKQAEQIEGICKALSVVAPELGEALSVAFSGPLGPLLALGMAVNEVRKEISDYNDELDREAAELYQPHLDAVKALQDAWDDAAKHMAEYHTKLAHAGEDADPIGAKFEQAKELEHAKDDADRKIAESEGKVAEAKARDEDAKKGVSSEATASDVAKARSGTQKRLDEINDAEKSDDIRLLEQESTERAKAVGTDDAAAKDARRKAQAAQAQFESDEARRKRLEDAGWNRPLNEEEIARLKKEHPLDERVALSDAQAKLEETKNAPEVTFQGGIMAGMGQPIDNNKTAGIAAAQAAVDAAQKAVDLEHNRFDTLNKTLPERRQNVTDTSADADRAEQITIQDEARRKQLPAKIALGQAVEDQRLRGEIGVESNLSTAADINTRSAASSNGLEKTQAATIAALYELLNRADQNSTAILQLIQTGVQKHESTDQLIKDVQEQVRYMQRTGFR